MVKPSAHDCKIFRESNNWVEHKESFMITLEAKKSRTWLTRTVELPTRNHMVLNQSVCTRQQRIHCFVIKSSPLSSRMPAPRMITPFGKKHTRCTMIQLSHRWMEIPSLPVIPVSSSTFATGTNPKEIFDTQQDTSPQVQQDVP